MSPVPGLSEKIAANLVTSLLKASAGIIRKRLSQGDAKKALETAIAAALAEALEGQELRDRDQDWEHYGSLLEEFLTCEEAAFELAQLLDPRPDQTPDLSILAHEFRMAGYDPETLPGFDLDAFLMDFFAAFYAAAGTQDALRAGIDLKLLGTQLQKLGIVVSELGRVADASESSAASLKNIDKKMEVLVERFVAGTTGEEEFRRAVEAARAEGFLSAYRTFEGIGSGLLRLGLGLGVDARGVLEIVPSGSETSRALPPARLESVRRLAGDLYNDVEAHPPTEDELNALENRYRQHIIRWFENLTFQGMMHAPRPIVLPLEEVYVELRAVAEVPEAADAFSVEERRLLLESDEKDETKRRELMSQLDALRRERWSRTIPERKSMAEALHQRDRRAFVILGDPGSGKTTLLHFLALVYARGPETAAQRLGVDLAEADRLPIFVPLAAFDDMLRESQREGPSLTLREFLPRYYSRRRGLPGLEPLFRRAFDSGRALVLLDGLDEVLDVGTRTYVAQQASALIGDLVGVRFAVSSRFVGYREAPLNLPTLSVLDFGTPEIETFGRRWAHAFEKWAADGLESPEMLRKAQKLEVDLLVDVKSNESVRRLAANPLMLTMLALLRRQVGKLPHRRIQLYESYVGTLLENWVDARSDGARERSVAILDQHQAESILIPLAFWLQKEKPSGTAGRAEIRNKLVEICLRDRGVDPDRAERPAVKEAETQADRFLQEMRQMAGLIIERGHDAFGFLHLTFQEYFAGRALAQLKDDERWEAIRPNLHDPRWREPILLCAGRLGVVENRRAQVTQLVRNILDNDDPTEGDLHRNLLFALSIACDDVNLEPALVSELVEQALAQLSTPINSYVRELLGLLGQLMANGMADFEACLTAITVTENGALRQIAIGEWGRFAEVQKIEEWLREQLESSDGQLAGAALDALAFRLGEEEALRQKALTLNNTRALARIVQNHPDVREELLKRLERGEWYVRRTSLIALSGLVKVSPEVRRVFFEKLSDSDNDVRIAAIHGLAAFVSDDAEIRRALLEKLDDNGVGVQLAAVKALSRILDKDEVVLSRVMKLLTRGEDLAILLVGLEVGIPELSEICVELLTKHAAATNWYPRQFACRGLAEAGLASLELLRMVLVSRESLDSMEHLRDFAPFWGSRREKRWIEFWLRLSASLESERRVAAMIALRDLVKFMPEVRRAVLKRLEDSDEDVRGAALSALSGVVGTDEEVRCAVLDRLSDSGHVRAAVLSALTGIVGTDEEVRGAVLESLEDEDSRARQSALSALSSIVGKDEEVRRAVLGQLEGGHFEVRQSALSALSSIVGKEEEVRRAVLGQLEGGHFEVRQSALSALSGAIEADEEVRRSVLEQLRDPNDFVRGSALFALSGIIGTDEEARRAVLEQVRDPSDVVRDSALSALSRIVGSDEEARRLVMECMGDESPWVRQQAIDSLSNLMEDAEVRQAILRGLDDQDFLVRLRAIAAIAASSDETLLKCLRSELWAWLGADGDAAYSRMCRSSQAQIAKWFGTQLPKDSSLRDELLMRLREPRWSERLGAALALLAWPGGPPDEVMSCIFAAVEDCRGLEAYPAQLAAASHLINRNETAAEAIDLCLEALDYGTQPWEGLLDSRVVRQQAAVVLGKLEPVSYDDRIYDKILDILRNDESATVRDAAYGTLVRLARMRDQQAAA